MAPPMLLAVILLLIGLWACNFWPIWQLSRLCTDLGMQTFRLPRDSAVRLELAREELHRRFALLHAQTRAELIAGNFPAETCSQFIGRLNRQTLRDPADACSNIGNLLIETDGSAILLGRAIRLESQYKKLRRISACLRSTK